MNSDPRQSPYTYPAPPYGYNPNQITGLEKWNWGAFSYGWIWGAANKCYIALLQLIPVPFVSLIVSILLGIYGNRWAYKQGDVKDVRTFQAIQKTWNIAGLICFILQAAAVLSLILSFLLGSVTLLGILGSLFSYLR